MTHEQKMQAALHKWAGLQSHYCEAKGDCFRLAFAPHKWTWWMSTRDDMLESFVLSSVLDAITQGGYYVEMVYSPADVGVSIYSNGNWGKNEKPLSEIHFSSSLALAVLEAWVKLLEENRVTVR